MSTGSVKMTIYSFPKLLLNATDPDLPEKIHIGGHLIRILLVLCHYTIGHMSKQVFKDKNFFPAENIQTFYSCIPSSKLLHRLFPLTCLSSRQTVAKIGLILIIDNQSIWCF